MSNDPIRNLRAEVQKAVDLLDSGGVETVPRVLAILKSAGATRGVHEGRTDLQSGSLETVEWYAGQIVDVLESESWFAVQSIINCCDRFLSVTEAVS